MSSHPQGRLLESPTDVHSHITQKLSEDGLNPESSDLEKLLFLWKLYQHVEDDLRTSRETEAKLKEAQAEEMKEVESYVEHIRHLSDERETLIQELETENESLKAQIVNLEQGNNETAQAEIIEMLTQQGLAEISDATQSEQIAYLLVERARLLDELEEHNNNNQSNDSNNLSSSNISPNTDGRSSETELKQILEQERGDFEEELNQQRESAKVMREQLKREHEEEINALMEENSKLEDDLQRAEMQVSQLKAELSKYEENDDDMEDSIGKSSSIANDAERKKLNEERNQLNREKEDMEKELEDLENEKKSLKAEKEKFNQEKSEFEREKSNVIKEKESFDTLKSQMEADMERVEKDKASLSKQMQDMENSRADLEHEKEEFIKEKDNWEKENRESPRTLSLRAASPSRTSNDMALRKIIEEKTKIEGELVSMKTQMRSLQKDKDSHDNEVTKLKNDLEKSLVQQQQLQIKNRSLSSELQELEMQLDEAETSMDQASKEKKDLSEKCDNLNSEMKTLRADAQKSSTLQDIVDILNNDKKLLSESFESLKKEYEQTSTEKQELANQNNRLSKEEQELTNELKSCKEELQKVTKEKDHLASEKSELLTLKKKQEDVETLLRADLEEMLKVKENFVSQTETLSKENKDLMNKLDRTREDLESARIKLQELAKQQVVIEHLQEQNQQLISQMSSTQDDLDKSKDRETMLITTQQSLQKNYDDTEKSPQSEVFTHEIDDLKLKLELTLQELAKTKKQVDEIKVEKKSLGATLEAKDKSIQEHSDVKKLLEEERSKKNNLQLDVNRLEVQLAEKTIIADKFDAERKQRLELESQIASLHDVEESLKVVSRELEKEKKIRKSLETHSDDLEKTISSRVSKEELTSALDAADKEKQLRLGMEERVKELEYSLKELQISSQSVTERLQNEQGLRQSLESNVKDLQVALTQQGTTEELSRLREELNTERAAVKELEESKEDVQLLCGELEKERSLRAELTRKVAELETITGESATSTLKATLDELDRERRARAESDMRLQEMEQILEDQRMDSDTLHHSMSTKMMSLEKRVQALQDDLFTAQDELQAFQEGYDEAVREAERLKAEAVRQQTNANPTQDTMTTSAPVIVLSSAAPLHTAAPPKIGEGEDERSSMPQMQETLNELNLVKSKLCSAETDLLASKANLESSRKEIDILKQSLELTTGQLEGSEEELRSVRQHFSDTQASLKQTKTQLEEKQAKLDSVVQDRAEIQRELDTMYDEYQQRITPRPADPAMYGAEERQEHMDRISTLEKLSRQLELDNREMARKLSDTITKSEEFEDQLGREKLKNTDRYQQSSRYTDQLEHDLDAANKHIRQLREEVQQHHTKMFKFEADNLGTTAKYESTIARLEQEIKDLKHRHRQELDSLSERMEESSTEARELRSQKREVDQELNMLRLEVSRLKSNNERLENHLQAETKQRQEFESRNSIIDGEMTKVWTQVRSLMEKNAELETSNRNNEQELVAKKSTLQQVENTLSQKEIAFEVSNKTFIARAEAAEKKTKELQKELEDVTQKLLNVERQLAQSDTGKIQLEDTKDKLVTIRNQLEGEKLQRTLLDQTVAELKHQVALLKQRESKVSTENKELQHTILDLESRLSHVQENINLGYDTHNQQVVDVGKRSLMEQITRLQREVKELQYELFNASERRDIDVKRYEERKLRTKAKLMKARDFYTTERSKYMDHMRHLEEDLRLTRSTLSKEKEWKDKMDDSYKDLVREKRELITQLSEVEESLRDKTRNLSMAQVRTKYLEEENGRQQERIQALTQQKNNLEKLLKDFGKRERMRVMSPVDHTVGTSGLGNSLDSAWDPNDMTGSWSSHIEPPANFRRGSLSAINNNNNDVNIDKMNTDSLVENESSSYLINTKQDNHDASIIMPRISGGYSLYRDLDGGVVNEYDV